MPHALDGLIIFGMMLLGLLIGVVILQAACALYNKLAGVRAPFSRSPRMDRRWEQGRESETGATNEPWQSFAPNDAGKPDYENADRPGGVPQLSLGQAVGIIFLTTVVNAIVGFLIDKVFGGARVMAGGGLRAFSPVAYLVMLPVSILVMGALLPTGFGKGLLVALLYGLIWLVLGIVLIVIVFVIVLVFGGLHNLGG